MTIEELKDLRTEVQAELDHHDRLCMSTWSETCLLELIDAEIERQEPCDACNNGDHGTKFKIDIGFGKPLSLNFHYCPTCGRKLRGDE